MEKQIGKGSLYGTQKCSLGEGGGQTWKTISQQDVQIYTVTTIYLRGVQVRNEHWVNKLKPRKIDKYVHGYQDGNKILLCTVN